MRSVFPLLVLPLVHQPPDAPPPGPELPWIIKSQRVKLSDPYWQPALSPDGKQIACTSAWGAFVVSYPDGKLIHRLDDNRLEKVRTIAFTPDGKKIVGVHPGIRVWDAESGDLKTAIEWDWLPEEKMRGNPLALPVLNTDCTRAYVARLDNMVAVLDVATGKELARAKSPGRAWALALSPDGKRLAVGTKTEFRVLGAEKLDDLGGAELKPLTAPRQWHRVVFPGDSDRVLVVTPDEKSPRVDNVSVWDVAKGKFVATYPKNRIVGFDQVTPLPGGRYAITSSPGLEGGVGILDLKDCRPVYEIGVRYGHMHPAIPTPDGKSLVGGSESSSLNTVKVEDILNAIKALEEKPEKKP